MWATLANSEAASGVKAGKEEGLEDGIQSIRTKAKGERRWRLPEAHSPQNIPTYPSNGWASESFIPVLCKVTAVKVH